MFSSLIFSLGVLFSPAHAFQPDADTWIGIEPIRHLSYHVAQQHRLRADPQWKQLVDQTGWNIRFDEKTGLVDRGMGPGIPLASTNSAQEVESSFRLFLKETNWVFAPSVDLGAGTAAYNEDINAWYVHIDQYIPVSLHNDVHDLFIDSVAVWRGGLDGFVKNGQLTMVESALYPQWNIQEQTILSSEAVDVALVQGAAPNASHDDVHVSAIALPIEKDGVLSVHICWKIESKTEIPKGHWVAFVDAHTGDLLNVYNEVRFLEGTVHATHDKRTLDGDMIMSPLPFLKVGDGSFTDEDGFFSIEDETFTMTLNGKNTRVSNDAGDDLSFELINGALEIEVEGDEAFAQIDQFVYQQEVYAWAKAYAPHVVNEWPRSVVNVNLNDVCNAYFDGTLNFYRAGEGCNNTGRIRDVSHHEWGHGFHYYNLLSGDFDGAMSEGLADAIAFFHSGDAVMAPYFGQNGYGIREAATNRVYPDDIVNEVHTDGLIFAGAIWDLWPELEEEYGDPDLAYEALMTIFVQGLRSGPDIAGSYDALLFADDDNGDLSDGTPHECALVDAFGEHGLGPKGEGGFFQLSHIPLENATADISEYDVDADLQMFAQTCADASPESARIHYSIDDGESWSQEPLSLSEMDISGALSGQEEGSIVQYYLSLTDDQGRSVQIPEYGTINPFNFYVGALEEINCNDFEENDGGFTHELISGRDQEGADDWMWNVPVGSGGDPDYAASGDKVWGNDLGGEHNGEMYNGEYQNDKHNRLTTPDYDVSGYDEVLLVYKRWLHVEDGYYDKAQILANGDVVWTNHETRYEVGDEHHRDMQWQQHVVRVPAADLDAMNFSWEIISDAGLSMGGWTIDDVCVYGVPATPEEENDPVASGCACSSSSASGSWMWLLLGVVGLVRRRRE